MFLAIENGVLRSATPTGTPYPPPPHSPAPPIIPHAGHYISQGTLYDIMARFITDHRNLPSNHPNLDLDDLDFITTNKSELPGRQRAQAEQVINTAVFRRFIAAQSSRKLLIQWDVRPPRTFGGFSPLSVVCAYMAQMLRGGGSSGVGQFDGKEKRFIPALWFCGRQIQEHPEHHSPSGHWEAGVMLACLILQVLRQHSFDLTRNPPFLDEAVNLEALSGLSAPQHRGNENGPDGSGRSVMVVDELLRVLGWLICGLPETVTLFIIVDGVALYEREQFESEALRAFAGLLRFSGDGGTAATVKVLFTSVPGTDTVRAAFEEDYLILEVDGLSRSVIVSSEDRMGRELEGDGEGPWI